MQVSGVEIPQQGNADGAANKSQSANGGVFAAFLKTAIGSRFSPMRLEAATALGQTIVPDAPLPVRNADADPDDTAEASAPSQEGASDEQAVESNAPVVSAETRPVEHPPTADPTAAARNGDVVASAAPATNNAAPKTAASVTNPASAGAPTTPAAALASNPSTATQPAVAAQNAPIAAQPLNVSNPVATPQQSASATVVNGRAEGRASRTQRLTAQVTDTPQQIVSKPANTLAANAAVAAQSDKSSASGAGSARGGETPSENSGNLLLNNAANKTVQPNTGQRTAAAAQANNMPAGERAPSPPPQPVSFAAAVEATQAASASRPALTAARGPDLAPLPPAGGFGTAATPAGSVRTAPTSPQPSLPPRALTEQIAVQIQRSVGQGADRIKIQLKPAELGRVEIKLDVMQDGRVAATIFAERPETLEMLQRDARGLQQALQDAGLKTDNASLSFNHGNASGEGGGADDGGSGDTEPRDGDAQSVAEADDLSPHRRASDSLVDVEV